LEICTLQIVIRPSNGNIVRKNHNIVIFLVIGHEEFIVPRVKSMANRGKYCDYTMRNSIRKFNNLKISRSISRLS
jgi:hypothetical protein